MMFTWVDLLSVRSAMLECGLMLREKETNGAVWCSFTDEHRQALLELQIGEDADAADGHWTDLAILGVLAGGAIGVHDALEAGAMVADSVQQFSAIARASVAGPVAFRHHH